MKIIYHVFNLIFTDHHDHGNLLKFFKDKRDEVIDSKKIIAASNKLSCN